MATNPLTLIDDVVADAFRGSAGITAIVPADLIQVWDREVDVRGDVEDAPDLGRRLWITPIASPTDFNFSSGSTRFTRRYRLGFGTGGVAVQACREMEWQILIAARRLHDLQGPDGSPLDAQVIAPLALESASVGTTDPEREPLFDPQEWTDVCELTVVATAPDSALV